MAIVAHSPAMIRLRSAIFLALPLLLAPIGCDGRSDAPADAGGGRDGGTSPIDASAVDAAAALDASTDTDAATESDASITTDASADDAATSTDAAPPDACVPPPCAAPPDGCRYQDATLCTCGTLVCEPTACTPECGSADYCDLCASSPACVTRPPVDEGRVCPGVYMPVCGCDGRTYGNGCELGRAGIAQLHDGECAATI